MLNQTEKEKLDPFLQQLFSGEEINRNNYSIHTLEDGTILYGVLIKTGNIQEIKHSGIQINSFNKNIATAKLRAEDIRKLVNLESVIYISNSKKDNIH